MDKREQSQTEIPERRTRLPQRDLADSIARIRSNAPKQEPPTEQHRKGSVLDFADTMYSAALRQKLSIQRQTKELSQEKERF